MSISLSGGLTVTSLNQLSVVICSHNPNRNYLRKALHALQMQSLPQEHWELLLIDNLSHAPLSSDYDLAWHTNSRHILEPSLGLTFARLRGIDESTAPLIVFVDDDNVLAPDYLQEVLKIAAEHPQIGAFGGRLIGSFDSDPPGWALPYVHMLAIRDVPKDRWCNIPDWSLGSCPAGAGMVVRRCVVERYKSHCQTNENRKLLGRRGTSLVSCEDLDIAFTSCDLGLGTGVFSRLSLHHLIPPGRLEKAYLLKLAEANSYSGTWLEYIRKGVAPAPAPASLSLWRRFRRALGSVLRRGECPDPIAMEFKSAADFGRIRAGAEINEIAATKALGE
jgi:glycosyltransferase involved in cell wall biosynthesis